MGVLYFETELDSNGDCAFTVYMTVGSYYIPWTSFLAPHL